MRVRMREWVVVLAIVFGAFAWGGVVWAQENGAAVEMVSVTKTVRGRVVNKVTNEPIVRALVTTVGDEYAVMTDDRGQFEFKMTERESQMNSPGVSANGVVLRTVGPGVRAATLQARKPGYLAQRLPTNGHIEGTKAETDITIYLVPEALIVGHVNVPGREGEVRIDCELYRRQVTEGKEKWNPAGTFTTWANGEFRFSGLEAGTYKLITHEQMDRDSLVARPGAELFGYPPIYYPNTTDFSLASPIAVKAGETAQANVTVERRAYYPVQIPVRNAAAPGGMNVLVYPMGHWGPGWSLGYNPMEQAIVGILPDGNYTLEVQTESNAGSTGMANFSVQGGPTQGPTLNLIPNAQLTVNVQEEFQTRHTELGAAGVATYTQYERQQRTNASVMLIPIQEFDVRGQFTGSSEPVEGTQGRTLTISNVRPGRYRVNVAAYAGYVAAVESGGVDLMTQPLVVGMGAGVAPIEVTLRDDGAEVLGTAEESGTSRDAQQNGQYPPFRCAYLLPLGEKIGQNRTAACFQGGTFKAEQVPPGDYLVLAYEQGQENLPFGDEEFVKRMEGKGQRIHVEAGEKVSVKVKLIAGTEGE